MTVDQSLPLSVSDGGKGLSRFEWLPVEEVNETRGGKPDNRVETAPEKLMPPPALPIWPRVYPGL